MKRSIVVIVGLLFLGIAASNSRAVINSTNTFFNSVVSLSAGTDCTNVTITVNYDDDADAPFDGGTFDWMYFVVYDYYGTPIAIDDVTAFTNHRVGQTIAINDSFPANPSAWPFYIVIWDTDGNSGGYDIGFIETGTFIDILEDIDPTSLDADCASLPNGTAPTSTPTSTPIPTDTPAFTFTPTNTPTITPTPPSSDCVFQPGFYEAESDMFLSCAETDWLDITIWSDGASGGYSLGINQGNVLTWQINGVAVWIYRRLGTDTSPYIQFMEVCFDITCTVVDNSLPDPGSTLLYQGFAYGSNISGIHSVSIESLQAETRFDAFMVLGASDPAPEETPEIVVFFPPPDPSRHYADVDGHVVAVDLVISAGDIALAVVGFGLLALGLVRWAYYLWKN